jgi:hypothetical protein
MKSLLSLAVRCFFLGVGIAAIPVLVGVGGFFAFVKLSGVLR